MLNYQGGEPENSQESRGECLLIINQKKCDLCCQNIPYSYYCWGSNYKCIIIHIKTIHDKIIKESSFQQICKAF